MPLRSEGPPAASAPSPVGHVNAEELGAILDTTAEGIVMFDAGEHQSHAISAPKALFGDDGADLVKRNFAISLHRKASRGARLSRRYQGRGCRQRARSRSRGAGADESGGLIPLSMTMGRTRPDGPNFFAVFRDQSHGRKSERSWRRRDVSRIARRTPGRTCSRGSVTRFVPRSTPLSDLRK